MTYQADHVEEGSSASLQNFSVFPHSFQDATTD